MLEIMHMAEKVLLLFQIRKSHDLHHVFISTEAEKAANALNGRWFGGRVIKAEPYDELKFSGGDLSA